MASHQKEQKLEARFQTWFPPRQPAPLDKPLPSTKATASTQLTTILRLVLQSDPSGGIYGWLPLYAFCDHGFSYLSFRTSWDVLWEMFYVEPSV
jgi:hypothetical protein